MIKLLLFLLPFSAYSLTPKEYQPMKTSVIIPCHPAHAPLLDHLLHAYADQTQVPDEIVISLSEAPLVSATVRKLEEEHWPFSLKILKHKEKYPPGKNRNLACQASSGELILCQDADDLPHPQRVEIIKHLFEHYELEHLLHQWQQADTVFKTYTLQESVPSCASFRIYEQINIPEVHNGSVAFTRPLFDKVHWQPLTGISEDALFNRTAYVFTKHRTVLQLSLLKYRYQLSTFDLDGTKSTHNAPLSLFSGFLP